MHNIDAEKTYEKKIDGNYTRMLLRTNPGSNNPQNSNCTATYLPPQKLSKQDQQDILDTAREVRMNLHVTFSNGLKNIDTPMLTDQQELTSTLCRHWMPSRKHTKGDGR